MRITEKRLRLIIRQANIEEQNRIDESFKGASRAALFAYLTTLGTVQLTRAVESIVEEPVEPATTISQPNDQSKAPAAETHRSEYSLNQLMFNYMWARHPRSIQTWGQLIAKRLGVEYSAIPGIVAKWKKKKHGLDDIRSLGKGEPFRPMQEPPEDDIPRDVVIEKYLIPDLEKRIKDDERGDISYTVQRGDGTYLDDEEKAKWNKEQIERNKKTLKELRDELAKLKKENELKKLNKNNKQNEHSSYAIEGNVLLEKYIQEFFSY